MGSRDPVPGSDIDAPRSGPQAGQCRRKALTSDNPQCYCEGVLNVELIFSCIFMSRNSALVRPRSPQAPRLDQLRIGRLEKWG